MQITLEELTVDPAGWDAESFLSHWEWLLPEACLPVLVTAMGDVFAQGQTGAVYFLDTTSGTVARVAADGSALQERLADQDFVGEHFYPERLVALREGGLVLGAGECYTHEHPLVLGGEDDPENIDASDAAVHVGILGQVHRQVKDLPDGTPIGEIVLEE